MLKLKFIKMKNGIIRQIIHSEAIGKTSVTYQKALEILSIWSYATASSSNAVYIIGGTTSSEDWSSRVVQFSDERIGFLDSIFRNLHFPHSLCHIKRPKTLL